MAFLQVKELENQLWKVQVASAVSEAVGQCDIFIMF